MTLMKNFVIFALLMLSLSPVFAQKAKLSPQTHQYLLQVKKAGKNKMIDGYLYNRGANNDIYLPALIKVSNVQPSALEVLGVKVGTKAGNIWTVQVPPASMDAFIDVPGIEYIELDQPVVANMDTARIVTRVDSVHAGINLPMPYTGKDVVVGIMDAGFDYSHVTLFDTTGIFHRVKRVWEQKKPGLPPSQYFYGNELVTSSNMFTAKTDAFYFSHGAHVAGIAAGSGFGSGNNHTRYRGMAYESDLVFVGITPTDDEWTSAGLTSIIDGMSYIFSYAAINGKPAVANLSWGCTTGPHNGTSMFSQACDNLTGPGKIFVCSAGNNGQDRVHFNKTFNSTDTVINTILTIPTIDGQKRAWVDAWGEIGESFCLQANLYVGQNLVQSMDMYCSGDSATGTYDLYMIGQNNDTCFVTITTDSATYNNQPRIFLNIYNKTNDMFVIKLKGTSGTVNMWTGYVKNKRGYYGSFGLYPGIVPSASGNTSTTISDISSTYSAIAVGAYASRNKFTNIQSNVVDYTGYVPLGNIAPFSSQGPTSDGRTKPDITAPGLVLGSAVSSYDTNFSSVNSPEYENVVTSYYKPQNGRTYNYAMLMGTSMSSPAAAGIIALMLQVNPALDADSIMILLKQNAILDNFTGTIPSQGSNIWGYGKINAYRAILAMLNTVGIETVESNGEQLACILYPNPNKGQYNIDYNTDKEELLKMEVTDITGKNILVKEWKVKAGSNSTVVNLQHVPDGVYFTRLKSDKGSVVIKVLKQ